MKHEFHINGQARRLLLMPETARDKLLSFTDNRQDASLQSGHFNDFVHVSLLRCALYAALMREQELTFDRVARETVLSCGLTIRDIARNVELDPQSPAAHEVWRVFNPMGMAVFDVAMAAHFVRAARAVGAGLELG